MLNNPVNGRVSPAPANPAITPAPVQGAAGMVIMASGIQMAIRSPNKADKETAGNDGAPRRKPAKKSPQLLDKNKITASSAPSRRLLWVGDAAVPTGFATVTHSVLAHLHQNWEVIVSGINYEGAPHAHPYTILPAWQGGDMWGMNRFSALCAEYVPDVVIINNDWWNVAAFLDHAPKGLPIFGYMPVDGQNLNPADIRRLNELAGAIWYTDFGHQEAVRAGFSGARHVIPHGIDASFWQPVDRASARQDLGLALPADAFIVGNVNRNQPRKRLDVAIHHFASWAHARNVPNAWLLLHCATKDTGWNLQRVAEFYGVADRLILTGPQDLRDAVDASRLRLVYNALDLQISTTLGEGWGLTTMEGMACGVPQIVPDWAALGEWPGPAVRVRCKAKLVHPEINTVGALPDELAFADALQRGYEDAAWRKQASRESAAFVRQERFQWATVAAQFDALLAQTVRATAQARCAAVDFSAAA